MNVVTPFLTRHKLTSKLRIRRLALIPTSRDRLGPEPASSVNRTSVAVKAFPVVSLLCCRRPRNVMPLCIRSVLSPLPTKSLQVSILPLRSSIQIGRVHSSGAPCSTATSFVSLVSIKASSRMSLLPLMIEATSKVRPEGNHLALNQANTPFHACRVERVVVWPHQ